MSSSSEEKDKCNFGKELLLASFSFGKGRCGSAEAGVVNGGDVAKDWRLLAMLEA